MTRPLPWALLTGLLTLHPVALRAQLTVSTGNSPAQLVTNMLVGQGVTVSNVTFNGQVLSTPHDQVSAFNGSNSNIGLAQGIVLCTGRATMVQGPNNNPSLTVPPSNPLNVQDPDLAMLTGQQRGVAILEFDFVPIGDSISFRFVFGSEEYNEFVCSMYNDVFGFFLSGPGINGPFTANAINLGTVPGSNVPISVNSINNGTPGFMGSGASTCNAYAPGWQANSIYYVDNNGGSTVQLDGFTVPMLASARVQCGQTYHIKFALAHAVDGSLDSAVLIEGGSFSTISAPVVATVSTPLGDGILTEGCLPGTVTIQRADTIGDLTITLQPHGPGITEEDITPIPPTVTIPAGTASVSFPIAALSDPLVEGQEFLTVGMAWTTPCSGPRSSSFTVVLEDHDPVVISAMDQYLHCDVDSVLLEAFVTGGLGPVQLQWSTGDSGDSTWAPATHNATYRVTATDACPHSVSLDVHVNAGCDIVVPNVFTPNGDGMNDTWVITGIQRWRHTVRVFNRWGQVVFESSNYGNNWRANGLSDGTYFYEVISERADKPLTGSLTILSTGRR